MFNWAWPSSKPVTLEARERKFCKRCGRKLEPDDQIRGYDEFTGTPIQPFLHRLRCPAMYCGRDSNW